MGKALTYGRYNALSMLNVLLGALFTIYLGRRYGASKETDLYFFSVVIVNYLGHFVQSVWEAMAPYYVDLKIKNLQLRDKLYSIMLNDIVLIASIIVCSYFVITSFFDIISIEQKRFLNVFIFYLVFQNILFLNKAVLNLEHFYASFYIVDIIVYIILFLTVCLFDEILYLGYSTIIGTLISNILQFWLIFRKVRIKYHFFFYGKDFIDIYINSFKLKVGSLLYGSKDIMIASVLTSFGGGIYALYSYASKFVSIIMQIVNSPVLNIFVVKANYYVAKNKFSELKKLIFNTLLKTLPLYLLPCLFLYILIEDIVVLLKLKIYGDQINLFKDIIIILFFFNLIIVLESPFSRLLGVAKLFDYGLLMNFVFFVFISVIYILFNFFKLHYMYFLVAVTFGQFSNLSLSYHRYLRLIRNEV